MCYNKESSMTVFIYSITLSAYLWKRNYTNDRYMAFMSVVVAGIQLAEFLLWSNLECNRINHYSTIATHILIMLQPLCIFACSYYYDNTTIPKDILLGLVIAYGIWLIYYTYKILKYNKNYCTKPAKNGHLDWKGTYGWSIPERVIYFLPITAILFMKDRVYGRSIFSLLAILLFMSIKKLGYNSKWESLWCFVGNSLPLYTIILGKIRYS